MRNGSTVTRRAFDDLDAALAALGEALGAARSEGGLPPIKAMREFSPGSRVKARFEISTGSVLRRHEAGVDLMGDGRLVAFAGGVRRRPLEIAPNESALDAIRGELATRERLAQR